MMKRHSSRDAISIYQPDEKRVFRGKNSEIKENREGKKDKRTREDYGIASIFTDALKNRAHFNRISDII